jgi:hypothetical protein
MLAGGNNQEIMDDAKASHNAHNQISNLSAQLPFSCKPAAESASRFHTDVPAAGLTAATAC